MSEASNVRGERAYEYIREMILRNEITSGQKIPEQRIVEELGISRTPVREAVRRLAGDGLIVFTPNKSAVVITVDKKFKHDLGTLRLSIESLAATLALQHGSNRDFEELREISAKCIAAHLEGDMYSRIAYDNAFHTRLAQISRNEQLMDIQQRLGLKTRFVQTNTLIANKAVDLCDIEEHNTLVDALISRNMTRVVTVVRHHVAAIYDIDDALMVIGGTKDPFEPAVYTAQMRELTGKKAEDYDG